jgi:DNA-binding cell septation regulator SpoVG
MAKNTVKILDVELASVRLDGALRAFATVNLSGPISKLQVKVIANGRTGKVFAALPSQKAKNSDTYHPLMEAKKDFQDSLNEAVGKAYNEAAAKLAVA